MSSGSSKKSVGLSPIGVLVAWKIQTILGILVSIVVAILVEFGGMSRIWEVHEGSRLQNRTAVEHEMLKSQIGHNGLAIQTVDRVHAFYLGFLDRVLGSTRSEWDSGSRRHAESPESMSLPVNVLSGIRGAVARHSLTTSSFLREISFRVAGMTVGWIVMVFFFAVGLIDGLVRREVRRWSGGRESSWVYNTSSRFLGPVSMIYTVVLVAWPWTLNIAWAIAIFASINGPLLSVASARFKKYL